ncbi:MAG: phosphoribosylformylglycinamidine synthase subunit PurQ [Gemmatimonadota bacterium]|nr:phosphoribosylformylglycinamidine synthase subunit PurQ [Gemmatimonadota bacterium]
MAKPLALVLTGFGINCDYETEYAFKAAGGDARRVHVNDLIETPALLQSYQIVAVPGGFSFGDNIASGIVLANKLKYRLGEAFLSFIESDRLLIGICNGFQVLTRMGVLPDGPQAEAGRRVSLTCNDSGKFEDRWVDLEVVKGSRCVFTRGLESLELPVRHGEGKFVTPGDGLAGELYSSGQVVMRYCAPDGGRPVPYPLNPNGSELDIAGICDPTGRIFGLMPHPEAFIHRVLHPRWTREKVPDEGQGLAIFRNAVSYFS